MNNIRTSKHKEINFYNKQLINNKFDDEVWVEAIYPNLPYFGDDYLVSNKGRIYSKKTKKYLKLFSNFNNNYNYRQHYLRVCLVNDKKRYFCYAHRLVLYSFRKNLYEANYEVDHLDRNTFNNNLENLRWLPYFKNRKKLTNSEKNYKIELNN